MSSTAMNKQKVEAESNLKKISIKFSDKDDSMSARIIQVGLIPRIITKNKGSKS